MAQKETQKKKEEEIKKESKSSSEKYFYAVGRRKEAVAQVRVLPSSKSQAKIEVNGKELTKYFGIVRLQESTTSPLTITGQEEKFRVSAKVSGGGITGQAEAIRLGIARALVKMDENFRKVLRGAGFLTRDARVVERKKPGLRKARRAPQWAKR